MSIFSSAAMRALAPHLLDLAKGVLPLFTAARPAQEETPVEHEHVQSLQIAELQQAVTAQAAALRELAERSEAALTELEDRLRRQQRFSAIALAVAAVAVVVALWAVAH
jgi:hypothetical protein